MNSAHYYLTFHQCLVFVSCPNDFLHFDFFSHQGSCIDFIQCHISLISSNLESFLIFPLRLTDTFDTVDTLEEYRPVILQNIPYFEFV